MKFKMGPKRAVLMFASMTLMFISWIVDGEIADEDTREIVREELESMKEGKDAD